MQKAIFCTCFAATIMQVPAEAATDAVKTEAAAKTRDSPSLPAPLLTVPCAVSTRIGTEASKAALGHPPSLPQILKGKQIPEGRDILFVYYRQQF